MSDAVDQLAQALRDVINEAAGKPSSGSAQHRRPRHQPKVNHRKLLRSHWAVLDLLRILGEHANAEPNVDS
jgi:hypothetical protein